MPFSKRKEKMKGAAEEKGHKEKRKGEGRERSLLEIPGSGHAATQRRKDENTGMSGSMCTRFMPIPPESPIINIFQSFFVPFRDYSFTQRSVKKNT